MLFYTITFHVVKNSSLCRSASSSMEISCNVERLPMRCMPTINWSVNYMHNGKHHGSGKVYTLVRIAASMLGKSFSTCGLVNCISRVCTMCTVGEAVDMRCTNDKAVFSSCYRMVKIFKTEYTYRAIKSILTLVSYMNAECVRYGPFRFVFKDP